MNKAEQMIREYKDKYEREEDCFNSARPVWLDHNSNFSFLFLLVPVIILGVLYGKQHRI